MAQKAPKHILQAHRLICGRDKLSRKLHSKAEYRHLAEVRSLFEDRNIVGLGIAEKVSDKRRSGELSLCFRDVGLGLVGFVDQVRCDRYSQGGGDSGSLIVANNSGK